MVSVCPLLVSFVPLALASISSLSSVVSDDSPGSSIAASSLISSSFCALSAPRVRRRFDCLAGVSLAVPDLPRFVVRVGKSSASSPEASREDGCSRSAVDDFKGPLPSDAARLRFVELDLAEGDDIVAEACGTVYRAWDKLTRWIVSVVDVGCPNMLGQCSRTEHVAPGEAGRIDVEA